MFDQLSILFSLGMVVYVIARAAMLDAKLPWFLWVPEKTPDPAPDAPVAPAKMRRRG